MSGQVSCKPGLAVVLGAGAVLGVAVFVGAGLFASGIWPGSFAVADAPQAREPSPAADPPETRNALRKRLDYEARPGRAKPQLNKEVLADLLNLEFALDREYRAAGRRLLPIREARGKAAGGTAATTVWQLSDLHDKSVQKFVAAEGFGMERMVVFVPKYLELPEATPLALEKFADSLSEADIGDDVQLPAKDQAGAANPMRLPSLFSLNAFHLDGQQSFINLTGFAFVARNADDLKAPLKARFKPHQFRHVPQVGMNAPAAPDAKKKDRWLVRRIELVSLLKHEQPVAYVSEHLPRMDELRKAPTRPLNGFEEKALKTLRAGKTLATDATVNRIHMLGAVRATRQCLDCHQVERGDLLGAFTYELWRSPLLAVGENGE
jgi:hypothetical protein